MEHKPKLYATDVRHLTDARYFAAQGVDYLSANMEKGNIAALTAEQFNEIKAWLSGVEFAPELASFLQLEQAKALIESVNAKTVVLPYAVPPVGLKDDGSDYYIIQKLNLLAYSTSPWVAAREMARFYKDLVKTDAFFIDLTDFGDFILNMETINQLKLTNKEFNCFFMFDMPLPSLKRILNKIPLYGIAVRGAEEERLGVKSFEQLNNFFEMLES